MSHYNSRRKLQTKNNDTFLSGWGNLHPQVAQVIPLMFNAQHKMAVTARLLTASSLQEIWGRHLYRGWTDVQLLFDLHLHSSAVAKELVDQQSAHRNLL